jgi:hypothetical protein
MGFGGRGGGSCSAQGPAKTTKAADFQTAAAAPKLGQGCAVRRALTRLLTPRVNVGYRKDALHTADTRGGGTHDC